MTIIGPTDTLYEGGIFKAVLSFPQDYPLMPPKVYTFGIVTFVDEVSYRNLASKWFALFKLSHNTVYEDGRVCISILHRKLFAPISLILNSTWG